MQSPQKLHQRLAELLGPPGPDSDPLELMLRTVVATTAPMVEGVIAQYTPQDLDAGLESIALYFLRIRSDEAPLSVIFLEELGRLNAAAIAAAQTVEGTAAPTPEIPAAAAAPGVGEPAASPAVDAPAAPDTPPPGSPAVPPPPEPANPTTPAISTDTAPASSTPDAPASASSPDPPASSPEPADAGGSDTATSEPPPASTPPAGGSNPAPPWG